MQTQFPKAIWETVYVTLLSTALAVVIGIAVVLTAIAYIGAGTGGVVPYLMITVGPVLAVVYVYYFGFRKFDAQD